MLTPLGKPLSGKRILIVEDEPLQAQDLARLFQATGASAYCAQNVDDAVRVVLGNGTDFGVLDTVLWRQSTSDHIATLLQMKRIPFMVFSARAMGPTGAVACVLKPAQPKEVVTACAKYWLGRKRPV